MATSSSNSNHSRKTNKLAAFLRTGRRDSQAKEVTATTTKLNHLTPIPGLSKDSTASTETSSASSTCSSSVSSFVSDQQSSTVSAISDYASFEAQFVSSCNNNNNNKPKRVASSVTIDMNGRRLSKRKKAVRFNFAMNRMYPSGREMTEQEWRRCWFSDRELRNFKKEQAEVVKHVFAKHYHPHKQHQHQHHYHQQQQHQRQQQAAPKRRYSRELMGATQRGTSKQQEQNQHTAATTSPPPPHWRDTMTLAYQECRKVKKGNLKVLTGQVDRAALQRIYQEHPELVGLEVYILFALRGSVANQVDRILGYLHESKKRSAAVAPVVASSSSSSNNNNMDIVNNNNNSKESWGDDLFFRSCQALTQPAAVMVREIALAQAAALEKE